MDRRIIRRFALIAALLGLAMLIGIVGFWLIENYSLFDAFYMTLITITTVGYQEVRTQVTQGGFSIHSSSSSASAEKGGQLCN